MFLRNVPVRVGIYTGVCLSIVLAMGLVLANRVPLLERVALERNIIAGVCLALVASLPILKFYRSPWELLVSGLLAWTLLSITYRLLCMVFVLLNDRYSAFHVFVLGAVVYLICATLSWIGIIIWKVRSEDISRLHH
jgi:Na+/glutamate symporter